MLWEGKRRAIKTLASYRDRIEINFEIMIQSCAYTLPIWEAKIGCTRDSATGGMLRNVTHGCKEWQTCNVFWSLITCSSITATTLNYFKIVTIYVYLDRDPAITEKCSLLVFFILKLHKLWYCFHCAIWGSVGVIRIVQVFVSLVL